MLIMRQTIFNSKLIKNGVCSMQAFVGDILNNPASTEFSAVVKDYQYSEFSSLLSHHLWIGSSVCVF